MCMYARDYQVLLVCSYLEVTVCCTCTSLPLQKVMALLNATYIQPSVSIFYISISAAYGQKIRMYSQRRERRVVRNKIYFLALLHLDSIYTSIILSCITQCAKYRLFRVKRPKIESDIAQAFQMIAGIGRGESGTNRYKQT